MRDKLRVLLVSGEPHQGERMWRNLLKSDANVDLVHFTILRPPEKATDGTPINELSLIAFPVADLFGRKIKDFDLIIFDRYSSQAILPRFYLDNIVDYVREGGALLMAEGPDFGTPDGLYYTPLGEIRAGRARPARSSTSAFRADNFARRRQASGHARPGRRRRLAAGLGPLVPPDRRRRHRRRRRDAGRRQAPLLVLSRVDKGRVALLLSDQMWLWARGYDGGGPYLDLLRRLAHWLMKEPDLEEEALRASAQGRDLTIERQSVKGEIPQASVTGPDGKTTSVATRRASRPAFRARR